MSFVTSALLLGLLLALPLAGEKRERARPADAEDFFIISSVDTKKKQLLLKRATEVTELMSVTEKTTYMDERGKPLHLKDLRSGDTVYITSVHNAENLRVATRVRLGSMTLEEVHRRYLKFR